MNNRHKKALQHPLTVRVLDLIRYLTDKSSQARKLVQINYINDLLSKANSLFEYSIQYMDGLDTRIKMKNCLYRMQMQTVLIGYLESETCRKRLHECQSVTKSGRVKYRKHYGFDLSAVAYVDTICDELIEIISTYGPKAPNMYGEDDES